MTMPKQKVVSIHYDLYNPLGEKIDTSYGGEPLTFLTGVEQIIPDLERGVENLEMGQKKRIEIPHQRAYGKRDESLIVFVEKELLPPGELKIGEQFCDENDEDALEYTIVAVENDRVKLDANHPLAGIDLSFDVELVAVREPTTEELEHGHAHLGDGHHH